MKEKKLNHKGSAVVEATLLFPLFLFSMLAICHMIQCRIAEGMIYESASETAEYLAEYSYISSLGSLFPESDFRGYMDDCEMTERYLENGISGVRFYGTRLTEDNYILLKVQYTVGISLPFLPKLTKEREISIRQKAYVGDKDTVQSESASEEAYVYITDNRDVYHLSRSCTYLDLSIAGASLSLAKQAGYTPCEFCGTECMERVYVTDSGNRYHSDPNCQGLKRTIYRVRLCETGGIGGCTRCAD